MEEALHIGSHKDVFGQDRRWYRLLEMLPGALTWATLLGVVFFSWSAAFGVAFFIIVFDIYWLVKTAYLSAHLRATWSMMRRNLRTDWRARLAVLGPQSETLWQCVLLPMYKESAAVVTGALTSLAAADWPKERMVVVLAIEERAGEPAQQLAREMQKEYQHALGTFLVVMHPAHLPHEIPGKGSNTAYAARVVEQEVFRARNIPLERVLVSSFDIDTQVPPQYFNVLSCHFLTTPKPLQASYQPVPVYSNNIWDSPALSRVVAMSGTYWQMMQQARPERLATFSSHSMSFAALKKVGYWQRNIVSEDSRIFWQSLLAYDGDYRVVPLFYPVYMDANLAPTFWQTVKNVYRQQRRWAWGVENVPYLLYGFWKNKNMPRAKKWRFAFVQLEGFWSLATNPLLIFVLGWLPLVLGGQEFASTLLSYNLPRITRTLMTIAMSGLIVSAAIGITLLPERPPRFRRLRMLGMIVQWVLVPMTILVFGAVPGIDAQTRLLLGKYMGFWVTPKHRKQ